MRNDMVLGSHLNVASENVAVALDDAEHDRLIVVPGPILGAEKTFVNLDRLAGAAKRKIAVHITHVFADQVAHPPSGFVGDAQLALNFFRSDAVPGPGEKEHHKEPASERRPRALEGRPGSRVDLIAAMLANERAASFDPVIGRLFLALEAGQPFAEPNPHKVRKATIVVRETAVKGLKIRTFAG